MEEYTNEDFKPTKTKLRYKGKVYTLHCERQTRREARVIRLDLSSNGFKTWITNNNKKWQVWWVI